METEKKIVGKCPLCQGNIIKTSRGYCCENHLGDTPKCSFEIFGIIGNRKMSDSEISELLQNGSMMLDGFISREGKAFSSVITILTDGKIGMNANIAKCPVCGHDVRIGNRGFNCCNYTSPDNKCGFVIWRNIAGHVITLDEARQLCSDGVTAQPIRMYKADGTPYSCKLGLSDDKLKIILK